MNRQLAEEKLKVLSNDKLINVIQLSSRVRGDVFNYATSEALTRHITVDDILLWKPVDVLTSPDLTEDENELDRWNWAALLFSPVWLLANRLQNYLPLLLIPVVNLAVLIFLLCNANEMAFEKSEFKSVKDFMTIQRHWNKGAFQFLCVALTCWVISVIVDMIF